jgi:hypothetical protein
MLCFEWQRSIASAISTMNRAAIWALKRRWWNNEPRAAHSTMIVWNPNNFDLIDAIPKGQKHSTQNTSIIS